MNQIRKKKKSQFLFLILFLFSSIISAQSIIIEIKSDSLFINSQKVIKEITTQNLRSILGSPDREFYGLNTIWTYDNLGIRIYISPKDSSLLSIELDFKKDNLDFSPKKTFTGSFIINNIQITGKTSIADFEKMKEIGFKFSVLDMYDASTSYLEMIFDYSRDKEELEEAAISFKE